MTWCLPTPASDPVVRRQRAPGSEVEPQVASPAVCLAALLLEADVAHFERVWSINLMGVLHTLKAALPDMVQRDRGCCVVTGSIGGFMGECLPRARWLTGCSRGRPSCVACAGASGISAYCASKWAVRGLLESLRLEVGAWLPWGAKHGRAGDETCRVQLLGTGVTVQMPCPTFTDTAMIRDAQATTVRQSPACPAGPGAAG